MNLCEKAPIKYLLTALLKANIREKAPLLACHLTHLKCIRTEPQLPTNPVLSPAVYPLLAAWMHFQQSFSASHLLSLSLSPLNLHAFAYSPYTTTPTAHLFGGSAFYTCCRYFTVFPYSPKHHSVLTLISLVLCVILVTQITPPFSNMDIFQVQPTWFHFIIAIYALDFLTYFSFCTSLL